MRGAIVLALAALSCAKDPAPAPKTEPAIASASALLGPREKGPQLLVTVGPYGSGVLQAEREVVEPLEQAIANVPTIEEIESIATHGGARLYVSFASGTDPYEATQTLREAMKTASLPEWAPFPEITRADRDGGVMFVVLAPDLPGDAVGPGEHDAMSDLGRRLETERGVWDVRECGFARPVLAIEIDARKLLSFGITIDALVEYIESKLDPSRHVGIDAMMESFFAPVDGMTRLTDLVTLRQESRQGDCKVTGTIGRAHPTLRVWGTPEGIANAARAVKDAAIAPRVRTWIPGDGKSTTAIVDTMGQRDEQPLLRWLAHDRTEPAWLVQDGDEPAWLLAGPRTPLLSFSLAATEDLHVWWPGAVVPVTVRICGPELDTLVRTSDALAVKMRTDELLDDVAVWAPRVMPEMTFEPDRDRLADHGIRVGDFARHGALLVGGELQVSDHVVLRTADASALPLRGRDGIVMSDRVFTKREELVPSFIGRVNRQRCATVDLQPRRPEDRETIEALVEERVELPVGVTLTFVEP